MTDTELNEIEARAAAATPGPWCWRDKGDRLTTAHSGGIHVMRFVRKGMHDAQAAFRDGHKITPVSKLNIDECPDAQFIARACQDVPALIAEVRRLRTEMERITAACQDVSAQLWEACRENNRLVAENAHLKQKCYYSEDL